MSFIKKLEISVAIALMVSIAYSMISFAYVSDSISKSVLRMHVIANSDTYADQELKLKVRDALLANGAEIFDGSLNINNAVNVLSPHLKELENTAENVVRDMGFDYDVHISIKNEYFGTRTYDEITLPAGEYLALNVKIGEAKGQNWWCVMFPPMCISAANENLVLSSVLNKDEQNLVNRNPKYEPRFKIIELAGNLKNKLFNNK